MSTTTAFRFAMGRPPAIASHGMVAASNPFATRAGVRMLERGGSAADAAIAAAAMLCITEPMNTGVGGDLFALVGRPEGANGMTFGLDAAGPAPRDAVPTKPVELRGPRSTTVPGAAAGWAALAERFGRLGLDACLADSIDAAEHGLPVCARSAALWSAEDPCPPELGPTEPHPGQIVAMPELAQTLRRIAQEGPSAIYEGSVARAIADATWLAEQDLSEYRPRWVTPLRAAYRGYEVVELPPPTQGVVALEGLKLLEGLEPTLPNLVHCVRLALDDGAREVRDGADVAHLLSPEFIRVRRAQTAAPVAPLDAGTSHVCAIDDEQMAVSLIQSLFRSFGSGVVAEGTGVVLQNRGACFTREGSVRPGKRPYHTLVPGLLVYPDGALGAFGIVGGHLQAQAHIQLVSALVDRGLDPQAALDDSRFRVDGPRVLLEEGLWSAAPALAAEREPVCSNDWMSFGCGQFVATRGEFLLGASDPRMDGYAAGF